MEKAEKITLVICLTLIVLALIGWAWYAYAVKNPSIMVMRLEMDNNTLEAVRIMNGTMKTELVLPEKQLECCYPSNCAAYSEPCNHNCTYMINCDGTPYLKPDTKVAK